MVAPRDAATVMLVRDAPDLEVFMLRRNLQSRWIGGASLFPGGALDPGDLDPALVARCDGRDDASASARLGLAGGGLGLWIAAIRETFEEAGVLLARDEATGRPVDPVVAGRADRLRAARPAVASGDRPFVDFVEQEGVRLDAGALHPFSHWVTPPGAPRRYDTWFFVAEAPDGHEYLHDDGETVDSAWVRPAEALAAAARDELLLIFPTERSLVALAQFSSAADVIDAAAAEPPPAFVADFTGERIELPVEVPMVRHGAVLTADEVTRPAAIGRAG